jgi:Cupin domain
MRVVVTGTDATGKSVFAGDGEVETFGGRFASGQFGQVTTWSIWGWDEPPVLPADGTRPQYERWLPPAGGVRVVVTEVRPDREPRIGSETYEAFLARTGAVEDAEWAASEDPARKAGGAGMHRTRTIDIGLVLEGSMVVELDDGAERELTAGDWIVQNGIWHATRNPSDRPCRVVFFIVGA